MAPAPAEAEQRIAVGRTQPVELDDDETYMGEADEEAGVAAGIMDKP